MKIFTTSKPLQAEIIKGLLEGNGIHAVVMNKQDSSYGIFGEAEVFVKNEDALVAINLISMNNRN